MFTIFAQIATLKGNSLPSHRNIRQSLARVKHFRRFRQNHHFQRAPLPSHLNFSYEFDERSPNSSNITFYFILF